MRWMLPWLRVCGGGETSINLFNGGSFFLGRGGKKKIRVTGAGEGSIRLRPS